jgi:hypothetical protein
LTAHTDGSFAMQQNEPLNWLLIQDLTCPGIHEMQQTGKALAEAFYGKVPRNPYFNRCSQGGRRSEISTESRT